MANSFETDGRGPSNRLLLGAAIGFVVLALSFSVLMVVKSTGKLEAAVRVVADLTNIGDGLPENSDVKYHGVLVGAVRRVTPSTFGNPNIVNIDLKPEFAGSIPAGVTARVIPSNIFAVSAVQLVDSKPGGSPIHSGARIPENTDLPTVVFQTTLNKLRAIIFATARDPREDQSLGIMAALNTATENRRTKFLAAGAQMDRIMDQLNSIVSTEPDDTTISALIDASQALQQSAPDLFDALHQAVPPMQVVAEQRAQLESLINGGMNTLGTTQTALNNHTDRLVKITGQLTPVIGELANSSHNFRPGFVKLNTLSEKFFQNVWIPQLDTANMRVNLSLTPTYSYTRADCPQYGALKGPSCYTAPLVAVRPDIPETLLPQNYQPPKNLAPPRGTVLGPNGNLVAVGPPLVNPYPNLIDPNPPLPEGMLPAPPVPGSANPNVPLTQAPVPPLSPSAPVARPGYPEEPMPVPAPPPPDGTRLPAEAAAAFGGNVGPVGSEEERIQLSIATGQPATSATQLLLGPVARGMTVSPSEPPAEAPAEEKPR
jgi:virulence factor Mce-like protein